MPKRLVLYGDGLICPPDGFGEIFLDHLLMMAPGASWQSSIQGSETLSLKQALSEISLHVIGKAPQQLLLAFGAGEIAMGQAPENLAKYLEEMLHLVTTKTQSQVALLSLPEAFFPVGETRQSAVKYNRILASLAKPGIYHLSINPAIESFLAQHRESLGEKKSLHFAPNRLTTLGKLFLAQTVAKAWPWPLAD